MYRHCKTFYNKETKIWHGYKNILPIYNPNISTGQAILHVLRQNPNKITQISANNGFEITCKEMASLSIRAAQNLQLKGLQQEDVIGIMASNSQYLAPVVFGAFLCGTPISTLDISFQKPDIKHLYGITKPKLIFCDAACYLDVKESIAELNLDCAIYTLKGKISGVGTVEEFLKTTGAEDEFIPPNLIKGGDQTAAILCSSGTTGLPKGVCVSHKALLYDGALTINHDDVTICFSTLYWLSGMLMLLWPTLYGATRIILDEPFSAEKCFDAIEKYQITFIFTPPSQIALLLDSTEIETRNLSSLRFYLSGGSYVHPSISTKMQSYLKNGILFVGYGMSELFGCCTIESLNFKKSGSTGQVVLNTEIKIIDDKGNSLCIDETGEILIRICFKWAGYYGNPEATKNILDNDGWIHSGDLGYFDKDGFLFVIDRLKDILKYKNFQFYPTEIESVILEIPDVVEVSVCGIPDIVYTDLPAAAIVRRENSKLTEKDVYDHVAESMSDFKNLRGGVYFLTKLPKTASGKVQRRHVKEILTKMFEKVKK